MPNRRFRTASSYSAIPVTVSGAPRMKTIPRVSPRPCRSPVNRSGRAISQVVTMASSGGRPRCTAAVPKKFPVTRRAPAPTNQTSHSVSRPAGRISSPMSVRLLFWSRNRVRAAAATKVSSSPRARSSDGRRVRRLPPRRQIHSITPTVSGAITSRTPQATSRFSSISVTAKPPSTKV
ncbi:hypothetical protein CQW44_00670 [Streptomyces griseofuscus]|uniref:Uncharacterized protein n=1 Tax=Streptomyces griseofuscus TaxID=146922 RepID=A0A3R8QM35_9ACTN|nr:hypothetical protein CQW44_00670 [Streptomyces griseofuscus]